MITKSRFESLRPHLALNLGQLLLENGVEVCDSQWLVAGLDGRAVVHPLPHLQESHQLECETQTQMNNLMYRPGCEWGSGFPEQHRHQLPKPSVNSQNDLSNRR